MTTNAPVRTALIGYGYWGNNLARNLAVGRTVELVGIADGAGDQRDAARAAYPAVRIWSSLDDVLADESVEAVVIATPAGTHGMLTKQALHAGRHVLVEKPLALNVQEAVEVAELAEASGRVAMVGHTFLYSPPVQRLRDLMGNGELGRIQYLYSQRLSLGKIRSDCNALWNFAPHDIAIMIWLLNESPVEVSARGFSFIQPGIEDVCFASLRFPSGVGANVHVSWIDPRKTRLMTVVGDEKMVVYNDVSADQKLWLFDAGVARAEVPTLGEYAGMGEFQWRTRAGDILIPNITMREPLLTEIETFGTSCRTGEPPPSGVRHGVEVVRVLSAIEESMAKSGQSVQVDR